MVKTVILATILVTNMHDWARLGKQLILATISAAILNFSHIWFSDVINFRKFGFPDPNNLGKDILQVMCYH